MSLAFELEARTGCCLTWKRSVTPHGRSWWVLNMSARHTADIGSGFWPTATASDYGSQSYPSEPSRKRPSLKTLAGRWPTATASDAFSSGCRIRPGSRAKPGTSLTDATVRQWPSPQAHDAVPGQAKRVGRFGTRHGGRNLNDTAAAWRTPTASLATAGNKSRGGERRHELLLTGQAKQWSTPAAQDHKNDTLPASQARRDTLPGDIIRGLQDPVLTSTSGSRRASSLALNPAWVSALMGYPPDWLSVPAARLCELWATRSCPRSPKPSDGSS